MKITAYEIFPGGEVRIENRLKYLRRQKIEPDGHVMTLRDLGKVSGVDYRHLSDIERGKRLPDDNELRAICQALNITPSDIYDEQTLDLTGAFK